MAGLIDPVGNISFRTRDGCCPFDPIVFGLTNWLTSSMHIGGVLEPTTACKETMSPSMLQYGLNDLPM
jgi:hypothetical protein